MKKQKINWTNEAIPLVFAVVWTAGVELAEASYTLNGPSGHDLQSIAELIVWGAVVFIATWALVRDWK